MNLIQYYTRVIENVGLNVDDEGYIYAGKKDDKVLITADNGKFLVLPTREQIGSLYTENEEGEPTITKCLYNPLNEDVVKGDSVSLKRTKLFIEKRLSHIFATIGELLLIMAENKENQKNTGLMINKFLASINAAHNQGVRTIVDDKMIESWIKLYENSLKNEKGLFTIFLKKKGKFQGNDYNRLAVLSSDLYDELLKASKDDTIFGIKLRNKDIIVYRLIFEFVLNNWDEDTHTICIGSNDLDSPSFLSLMSIFITISERNNKILNLIKDIDKRVAKTNIIDNLLTMNELHNIKQFESELTNIPSDIDINRKSVRQQQQESRLAKNIDANSYNQPVESTPNQTYLQNPFPQHPVPLQQQDTIEDDPVLQSVYGNRPMNTHPVNQFQQPMSYGLNSMLVPSQPMNYQQPMPMQQVSFGINSMQPNVSNPASYYNNNVPWR